MALAQSIGHGAQYAVWEAEAAILGLRAAAGPAGVSAA